MLNEIYFFPNECPGIFFLLHISTKYVSQHSRLEKVIFNKGKRPFMKKL